MSRGDFENKSLVVIVAICYAANWLLGVAGFFCSPTSVLQLFLYQVGSACAIAGSVMAGRYVGLRGQQVAGSAYILLGITHGISLGALGRASINVDRGMTMVLPMIPALVFMFWCELYPKWLRLAGVIPIAFFTLVFLQVHQGVAYYSWPLNTGYGVLQLIEVVWAYYLWRDWRDRRS